MQLALNSGTLETAWITTSTGFLRGFNFNGWAAANGAQKHLAEAFRIAADPESTLQLERAQLVALTALLGQRELGQLMLGDADVGGRRVLSS